MLKTDKSNVVNSRNYAQNSHIQFSIKIHTSNNKTDLM